MNRFLVVAAVDFSEFSAAVLDVACELASARRSGSVYVMRVVEPRLGERLDEDQRQEDEALLRELVDAAQRRHVERLPGRSLDRLVIELRFGDVAAEITRFAAEIDADAIVVGCHGRRGLARVLLGSVAEAVVRAARCSVVVARAKCDDPALRAREVEPLCSACAATRAASSGRELGCAQHAQPHLRPHVYRYASTLEEPTAPWGFSS